MKHPTMCYIYVESTNEIGVVKWKESGYYRTDFKPEGTIEQTKEKISHFNEQLGISNQEAEAMKICSMVKPKNWQSHFEMIINSMK